MKGFRISGWKIPSWYKAKLISADDMLNEVKKTLPVDIAVCAAAVTDFKVNEKNRNGK